MGEEEPDWTTMIDESTGWLLPGVHPVELEDIYGEFVVGREPDRATIWLAVKQLIDHMKSLFASGRLLIGGTFVSRQPGPCDPAEIWILPDEVSTIEHWTDSEEERFQRCISLHDVIVGSLDPPAYVQVLHPFAGCVEAYWAAPEDGEQVAMWMGTVTLHTGDEIAGHRGVLEVIW